MHAAMIAIGKAASYGILVRSSDVLIRSRQIDTIVLDKTGTLTEGAPAVTDVVAAPGVDVDELLRFLVAVEANSEHPLGRAIVSEGMERGIQSPPVEHFAAHVGQGISGVVEGARVMVGSTAFLEASGVVLGGLADAVASIGERGGTPVVAAVDGKAWGAVGARMDPDGWLFE